MVVTTMAWASVFNRMKTLALSALIAGTVSFSMPINKGLPAMAANKLAHTPLIVAHRGGKRWAPENSMAAFKKSLEAKVDGIELDIHVCKSGELVVIHDDSLERTTNGTGLVGDADWKTLSKLDAGTWYKPEFKDEKLPLLEDVFDLVKGKLTINVEIKNCPSNYADIDTKLLALLDKYPYPDKIIISSFDHIILKKIHDQTSKYKLALLGDSAFYDLPAYAKTVGATAWNPDFDCVRPDTVKAAHDAGLQVNTWTVNSKEGWKKACALGVDAIITDDPEGLRDYLKEAK